MGHISFVGKLDGETLKGGAPALTPGWTLDLMAKHSLDFWLTSKTCPIPTTVSLSMPRAASFSATSRTTKRATSV